MRAMAGSIGLGATARLHVWPRGCVVHDSKAGKWSSRVGGKRWRQSPPRPIKRGFEVRSKKGGGEEWVLAIDVGTGGTKAALITSLGSVASSSFHPHPAPFSSPAGGPASVEQPVETWWEATIEAVQACLANGGDDGTVRALAVTGQMQNVILLPQDGRQPIPAAILYSDARAVEEAAEVARMAGGAELVASITGTHQGASSLLAKLRWLDKHNPKALNNCQTLLLGGHDYVVWKLCGALVTDATTASTTGLVDLSLQET